MPVKGGRLRRGLLYRSEGPAAFSDDHHTRIAAMGIRLVCDLRSAAEHRAAVGNRAWGHRVMNCDIAADFRSETGTTWKVPGGTLSRDSVQARILATYAIMPTALQPYLAALVAAVNGGETPLLIHCTAGKDRTGVLMALMLKLLGANDADIIADYLLSASFGARHENRLRLRAQLAKVMDAVPSEEIVDVVIGVDQSFLAAALAAVAGKWGSVESYFVESGVDEAAASQFRAALTEPAA